MLTSATPSSSATRSATTANSSAGGGARATRGGTRRRAARGRRCAAPPRGGTPPQRRVPLDEPAELPDLGLVVRRGRGAHALVAPAQRGVEEVEQHVRAEPELARDRLGPFTYDLQRDAPGLQHLVARDALPGAHLSGCA